MRFVCFLATSPNMTNWLRSQCTFLKWLSSSLIWFTFKALISFKIEHSCEASVATDGKESFHSVIYWWAWFNLTKAIEKTRKAKGKLKVDRRGRIYCIFWDTPHRLIKKEYLSEYPVTFNFSTHLSDRSRGFTSWRLCTRRGDCF